MAKKRKTNPPSPGFLPAMFPYIKNASADTLHRISRFDYGMEAERHFAALRQIMSGQNGYVSVDLNQAFYPGDVIELAAFDASDAFCYAVCHLMMIQSALAGTLSGSLACKNQHTAAGAAMYSIIKHSHLLFVAITLILFNLRFWLRAFWPQRTIPKVLCILPHINDTLLLLTGIKLMVLTRYVPFGNANWLGIKLILLVAYILLGMFCLKSPPRTAKSAIGYVLSMSCIGAVCWLARYKPLL